MSNAPWRASIAAVALALPVSLLLPGSAAQAAAPLPAPADAAADWLVGELGTDDLIHTEFNGFEFIDYGLNADVALALHDLGRDESSAAITDAIETAIESFVTDGGSGVYAGALGKALTVATELGRDPRAFGGRDLVASLEERTSDEAPIIGRIEDAFAPDDPFGGDYANAFGQAFAVWGLHAVGSDEADEATAFLLEQQCPSGWFRQDFTADKTAPVQSCEEATDSPSTDVTALAVLGLMDQAADPTVAAALELARAWLTSSQRRDGAHTLGMPDDPANTDSTGLAARALSQLGSADAAAAAAIWVRSQQVRGVGACDDVEDGAVAYDRAALREEWAEGITVGALRYQFHKATADSAAALQLIEGVAAVPSFALIKRSRVYVKAGSRQVADLVGTDVGDTVCVSSPGADSRLITDNPDAVARVGVTMPRGRGLNIRSVKVVDTNGREDVVRYRVLGAARFDVEPAARRVERRSTQTLMVSGLAPREPYRVKFRGEVVDRGRAGALGRSRATFGVGARVGQASVRVVGRFGAIRFGTGGFRVTR